MGQRYVIFSHDAMKGIINKVALKLKRFKVYNFIKALRHHTLDRHIYSLAEVAAINHVLLILFFFQGLAAKAVLWPLAGIALLGAAAALVSNPVLLQLGVISGRRRRDTEEVSSPDYAIDFSKIAKKIAVDNEKAVVKIKDNFRWKDIVRKDNFKAKDNVNGGENIGSIKDNVKRKLPKRMFRDPKREALSNTDKTSQSAIDVTLDAPIHNRYFQEDRYVPIRLKVKNN